MFCSKLMVPASIHATPPAASSIQLTSCADSLSITRSFLPSVYVLERRTSAGPHSHWQPIATSRTAPQPLTNGVDERGSRAFIANRGFRKLVLPKSVRSRRWTFRETFLYRSQLSRRNSAPVSGCSNFVSTGEMGEAINSPQKRTNLHVVLVSPQIPGNTGCIARTCAAAGVGLHLVEPLGFEISSAKLKRAGLDYWPYVVVKVHKSWDEFFEHFQQQKGEKRLLGFTKKGHVSHTAVTYREGDWLLFGSETDGLPDAAVEACIPGNSNGGGLIRIPIDETFVRCLNLSVAAGIGVYEALRQLGYGQNMFGTPATNHVVTEKEDIFG